MTERKMADVLWDAANVHLPSNDNMTNICAWSCNAALRAESPALIEGWGISDKERKASATDRFLKSLGCPTGGKVGKFQNYEQGSERQGVRYMWLLLAMHAAQDAKVML